MVNEKKYVDFINVIRLEKDNRSKEKSYTLAEDCVNSGTSAKIIVNHLIQKFRLRY